MSLDPPQKLTNALADARLKRRTPCLTAASERPTFFLACVVFDATDSRSSVTAAGWQIKRVESRRASNLSIVLKSTNDPREALAVSQRFKMGRHHSAAPAQAADFLASGPTYHVVVDDFLEALPALFQALLRRTAYFHILPQLDKEIFRELPHLGVKRQIKAVPRKIKIYLTFKRRK